MSMSTSWISANKIDGSKVDFVFGQPTPSLWPHEARRSGLHCDERPAEKYGDKLNILAFLCNQVITQRLDA